VLVRIVNLKLLQQSIAHHDAVQISPEHPNDLSTYLLNFSIDVCCLTISTFSSAIYFSPRTNVNWYYSCANSRSKDLQDTLVPLNKISMKLITLLPQNLETQSAYHEIL
jgi:hypothetical protein